MEPKQQQPPQVFGTADPQRLLKAKVRVRGRFLLRPQEEFGPDRAGELAERAVREGGKISTTLSLFNTGLRLGESGVFASMPLEYIKYQRIAACVALQRQPRTLAICTRDYEQRCVTIVQFKNAEALVEATGLIDRQRRLVAEEANYLSDMPKGSSSARSNNWAMETAPSISPGSAPAPQGPLDRRPAPFSRDITVPAPASPTRGHEARVTIAARSTSASLTDEVFVESSAEPCQPRKNDIETVILNFDDIGGAAKYAVFETNHGPPTLLNELRVVTAQSNGSSSAVSRPMELRVQTEVGAQTVRDSSDVVDGASTRPHTAYVRTSTRSVQRTNSHQKVFELQYSPPLQPQPQLVKLVPVRLGSHPPQHHQSRHHHRQQQVALYPASRNSLGRGYYIVTK